MELNNAQWRKSTRSGGNAGGNCVEVGYGRELKAVGVRDTKDRDGGTLVVSPEAFAAFVTSIK